MLLFTFQSEFLYYLLILMHNVTYMDLRWPLWLCYITG